MIITIFIIGLRVSYGQFGSMPVTTTIKTPHGNIPYTYYVPSMHNYYYNNQGPISSKYEFSVVLKNDSTFKVKTRINVQKEEDNFITVKDDGVKEKIYPSDTKSISRITYEGRTLRGIPADSCWLFLVDRGAINSYSFLAEPETIFVIAIQEGNDNPIVPLTKENLLPMIGGDAKANKHASKNNLIKAIQLFNQHRAKEKAAKSNL